MNSIWPQRRGSSSWSQFTLYADARRGRRPDFVAAARPEQAEPLFERCASLAAGCRSSGVFRAHMAGSW
jgi:D-tyrosyl-tRNA(Tyr) deacylase